MSSITIFIAKRIVTLNGYRPFATAVAVNDGDGRILCVGSLEECQGWRSEEKQVKVDETFKDLYLMPGVGNYIANI